MPRFIVTALLLVLACVCGVSCAHRYGRNRSQRSSSIVGYLYPNKGEQIVTPSMPTLNLPLRVGVAFVPSDGGLGGQISEKQKQDLLKRVADKFRNQVFISKIEIIPSSYLRPQGGFTNLQQVGRMLQLDLAVLVSYDQMQFSDDSILSFSYWTIVGAYIFNGNKNDTQTLVEAAVYDISTESFLFRAVGSDQLKSSSTGIKTSERQREDSVQSLSLATDGLIVDLDKELGVFKQQVKEGSAKVNIAHREGYKGGGGAGAVLGLGILALAAVATWRRRR